MQQDLRQYYPPAATQPHATRRPDDIRNHFREHKKNKAEPQWTQEDESMYDIEVHITEEDEPPAARQERLGGKPNVTLDRATGIVTKDFPPETRVRDFNQANDFFVNEQDNDFIVPLIEIDHDHVRTRYLSGYETLETFGKVNKNDREALNAIREKLYEGFESLNSWYSDLVNPTNIMVKIEKGRPDIKFIEGGKEDFFPPEVRIQQWRDRSSAVPWLRKPKGWRGK